MLELAVTKRVSFEWGSACCLGSEAAWAYPITSKGVKLWDDMAMDGCELRNT